MSALVQSIVGELEPKAFYSVATKQALCEENVVQSQKAHTRRAHARLDAKSGAVYNCCTLVSEKLSKTAYWSFTACFVCRRLYSS